MSATVLPWPLPTLAQALAPLLPGITVLAVADIDSTNRALMQRARTAAGADPALLVAERQSAAHGRMGRPWQGGAPGASLAFSLSLPLAPRDWSGLSLALGLAVAEALHPDIAVKWPNDLWWQGRKLAGILVETASGQGQAVPRIVVIGVGLNIDTPSDAGFSTRPAGLRELLPDIDAPAALLRIAAPLVRAAQAFATAGFAPLAGRFNARDALAGQAVQLSDGSNGQALGVGPDGALRVQTASGLRLVSSSEVSVRPQAAPVPEARP